MRLKLGAELDVELPSVDDPAKVAGLVHVTHGICPYSKQSAARVLDFE